MYKKVLILLVCLLTSASSWAGTRYYYMENPDPVHFQIVWKGANPNCHEMGPNGYETYGWIIHGKSSPEYIAIVQKDAPEFGALDYVTDVGSNTTWATLPDYQPYRTWACG